MDAFPVVAASRNSIAARRPVYGRGINDADYVTSPFVDGRQVMCPIYKRWHSMMKRAYCEKYHADRPTYSDCTVSDDWLIFSNFRRWMVSQDWEGKVLDKDILIPGNKVYSADRCVFVDDETNKLLNDQKSRRGALPQGVGRCGSVFCARISYGSGKHYLGRFDTLDEAVRAYGKAKAAVFREVALRQSDARVRDALIARADALLSPPATTSNRR